MYTGLKNPLCKIRTKYTLIQPYLVSILELWGWGLQGFPTMKILAQALMWSAMFLQSRDLNLSRY